MKPLEIRNLSKQEVNHKYLELKQELYNLRVTNRISRIENPNRIKQIKKDIARIKTILKEKKDNGKIKQEE